MELLIPARWTYSGKNHDYSLIWYFQLNKTIFSIFFELNKELMGELNFCFISAFDIGDLYYDSFGLLLRLSKSFWFNFRQSFFEIKIVINLMKF
jgi:hypothetical protein